MREYGYKSEHVKRLRAIPDSIALQLPLPRMNPSLVSALSVLTSLAFVLVLKHSTVLALLLILATVLLDWFDGLIARKHELCSREGYLVDLTADRISEGIMFIPYLFPWFLLFILNCALTLYGIAKHKHVVLPLRQAFFVVFSFSAFVLGGCAATERSSPLPPTATPEATSPPMAPSADARLPRGTLLPPLASDDAQGHLERSLVSFEDGRFGHGVLGLGREMGEGAAGLGCRLGPVNLMTVLWLGRQKGGESARVGQGWQHASLLFVPCVGC